MITKWLHDRWFLVLVGLQCLAGLVVFFAMASYPLPFPDAPEELMKQYAIQEAAADQFLNQALIGFAVVFAGLVARGISLMFGSARSA